MALGDIPKITWEASFANTLNIGYPLDNAVSYSRPMEGSEWNKSPAGVEDAWIVATEQLLEGDCRWIPSATTTTPGGDAITGWDGATGWNAFLAWVRDKNKFRFYPDKGSGTYHTCYIEEPMSGAPGSEREGERRVRIIIVDDGVTGAFTGYAKD